MKNIKSISLSKFVSVSFIIVLLGQLGFDAVSYYLNIHHPSWIFWFVLYGALLIKIIKLNDIKVHYLDVLFFLGVTYLALNFILLGESNNVEFSIRLILVIIGPYFIGRMYGKHFKLSNFKIVYGIGAIYILLIGIELWTNQSLLLNDRLILFKTSEELGGGSPTQIYIGYTFGFLLLISAMSIMLENRAVASNWNPSKALKIVVLYISLLILFFIGSRAALVSVLLTTAIMFLITSRNIIFKIPSRLIFISIFLVIMYMLLPESRQLWVDEMLFIDEKITYINSCITEGDSIAVRLSYLQRSWDIFSTSPFFGGGATNFSLNSCGEYNEFSSPHSLIVQIIAELGIFGLLIWLTMFLSLIRATFIKIKIDRVIMSNIFSVWLFFFILSLFSGNIYYDFHFFLLTGLLVSAINRPLKV